MVRRLAGILLGMLCCVGTALALLPVPPATGYVTDQTGVIDPASLAGIQARLARHDATSDYLLRVLLVNETPDEEIGAFADRVLDAWKLSASQKGGALLLWTAEGYVLIRATGLAGERLTADVQNEILSRWVIPAFAEGDAGAGVDAGVEQMIAVLEDGAVMPGQDPPAAMGPAAAPVSPQTEEALRELERIVGNRGGAAGETETPTDLPRWFESLPADLERIGGGIARKPSSGLGALWREIRTESAEIGVVLQALVHQARGARVEPPFAAVSIYAFYALVGVLAIACVLLVKGALVTAPMVAGILGAPLLWVATGLTALAAGMLLLGLLSPLVVPVLRVVLRGADDSERDPAPSAPWQPKPHVARPRPVRLAGHKDGKPAPILVRNDDPSPPPSSSHTPQIRRQQSDELIDLMATTLIAESRKLRPMHAVVAFVLLVLSVPLAILAALAFVGFVFYRDGVAHRFVEVAVTDKTLRERLKQHLPARKQA